MKKNRKNKKNKKTNALSTTQIIMLSFLLVILLGSFILALPISSSDGKAVPYIDALFTATTSVCVTGLVTVPTFLAWSVFGQIVILLLIQIGGLGTITVMSGFMIMLHKKMGISDSLLIQDAFNLNTASGLMQFVKKVILGTLIVEGVGAVFYMTVFVPEFGLKGIWFSIFNSVSAFCNAGLDIISENSLCGYVHNPIINFVTCLLIILGGLGFIVWWDIIKVTKNIKKRKIKCFKALTLHTKIVLSTTITLIAFGTLMFFVLEYNNPATMKDFSLSQKLMASLFQSVTTRTAGFATIPQENFTTSSMLVSLLLMFIGGSPVGTAGGIKTVTAAVIVFASYAAVKNSDDISVFNRTISADYVKKAVAVAVMSFLTVFVSAICLINFSDAQLLDALYEAVSATATVGLTRNFTPFVNIWGKLVIIATMYFGRVGPVSFALMLNLKKNNNIIKNPYEDISVG